MKIKYVKFSDERRREFCIKTIIGIEDGTYQVIKEAIFEEGKQHIRNFVNNVRLLENNYDSEICGVEIKDDRAYFEYVEGESLEDRYYKAMKKADIAELEKLFDLHKKIVLGKQENEIIFEKSDMSERIFGDLSVFVGSKALKCCNYDGIASNIIMRNEKPVFIDYEWIFDFPVPVDVVLYHCIQNFYLHYSEIESVYPIEKATEYLGIKTDKDILEKTYESFYNYVIKNGENDGYALMKFKCLKGTSHFKDIQQENIINQCECIRLQGVIDSHIEKVLQYEQLKLEFENLNKVSDAAHKRKEELEHRIFVFNVIEILRRIRAKGRKICKKH